jgi:hypothetical protein
VSLVRLESLTYFLAGAIFSHTPSDRIAMEPTEELLDNIYRDRVLRARQVPLGKKLLAGGELFEQVCDRMRDGLRDENPGVGKETIEELLGRRLDLLRRLRSGQ